MTFPDEIIANILTRLPPKELVRARVVCKQWHALTSEHLFMHTNLLRSNAGHPVITGFFLNDEIHKKFSYNPLLRGYSSPDLSFIPITADTAESETYVTSSCHGLLLCRRRRRIHGELGVYRARHYVCNPETMDFVEVNIPAGAGQYLNLAYDPLKSRHHYKIVARGHDGIRVYSSQTRSWLTVVRYDDRCRRSPFAGLRHPRGVFWNGSLVWAMLSPRLLRFAIDSGELSEMPLPPRLRSEGWFHSGWVYAYVGESGGHLQVIGYTDEERRAACFDVLEMRDDEDWTVLYRVDMTRVKELYDPEDDGASVARVTLEHFSWGGAPLHVVRGPGEAGRHGVLFFSVPGKIVCYDAESRAVSVVWEDTATSSSPSYLLSYTWFNFYAYTPSFLRRLYFVGYQASILPVQNYIQIQIQILYKSTS